MSTAQNLSPTDLSEDEEISETSADTYGIVETSFWRRTFTALVERDFAWFFGSSVAFSMGMQMHMILFGYLAFDLTGSSKALGLVASAGALPILFVGALGGALADRLDKRYLIGSAQLGAALTIGLIVVLVLTDMVALWHLIAASIALSCLISINMPARQAVLPALVPRQKLMNAVSVQMGGMNLTAIVAPALAGLLIAPLGLGAVLAIAAALFVAATAGMMRLPIHGMVVARQKSSMLFDLKEGFAYIWQNRSLRLLIILNLVMPILIFPARQMLPVFAREVFETGPSGLGLMAASTGVGGLMGALIAANLSDFRAKGHLMFIGATMMTLFTMLFALAPMLELAIVFLAVSACGQMVLMTTNSAVIQAILPPEMRGRVSAVTLMSFGVAPIAVLPVSIGADAFGPAATIAVLSAGVLVLVTVLFILSPRLRGLNQGRLERTELSEVQAAALAARGELMPEREALLSSNLEG